MNDFTVFHAALAIVICLGAFFGHVVREDRRRRRQLNQIGYHLVEVHNVIARGNAMREGQTEIQWNTWRDE